MLLYMKFVQMVKDVVCSGIFEYGNILSGECDFSQFIGVLCIMV